MATKPDDINPSNFNRKGSIKRTVPITDNLTGATTNAREDIIYDNIWCSFEGLSTNRKQYLGINLFTSAYELVFRAGADILTSDLFYYENKIYSFESIQLVEQWFKRFYITIVRDVTATG